MSSRRSLKTIAILYCCFLQAFTYGQSPEPDRLSMPAAPSTSPIKLDGILDEADWSQAPINDHFKTAL